MRLLTSVSLKDDGWGPVICDIDIRCTVPCSQEAQRGERRRAQESKRAWSLVLSCHSKIGTANPSCKVHELGYRWYEEGSSLSTITGRHVQAWSHIGAIPRGFFTQCCYKASPPVRLAFYRMVSTIHLFIVSSVVSVFTLSCRLFNRVPPLQAHHQSVLAL